MEPTDKWRGVGFRMFLNRSGSKVRGVAPNGMGSCWQPGMRTTLMSTVNSQ